MVISEAFFRASPSKRASGGLAGLAVQKLARLLDQLTAMSAHGTMRRPHRAMVQPGLVRDASGCMQ